MLMVQTLPTPKVVRDGAPADRTGSTPREQGSSRTAGKERKGFSGRLAAAAAPAPTPRAGGPRPPGRCRVKGEPNGGPAGPGAPPTARAAPASARLDEDAHRRA